MTAAAKRASTAPNGSATRNDGNAINMTSPPAVAGAGECGESQSPNGTGSTASSIVENPSPVTLDSKEVSRLSEPPARKKPRLSYEQRIARMSGAISTILDCLDDDPDREGLRKTPQRYAKALLSLTEGYSQSPRDVLGDAQFDENHSEMVLVRDIHLFSLCEHHILPFHGFCHIAYIPSGTVVGLSKLARIVNLYSRRLQVQERLTTQVADAVQEATDAKGVMVYLSCTHMCMSMRGVHKTGTKTVTTATRGKYATDASLRQEFLGVLRSATT